MALKPINKENFFAQNPTSPYHYLLDFFTDFIIGRYLTEILIGGATLKDYYLGEENYLFFKYALWFRYNSYMIGGFQNWP